MSNEPEPNETADQQDVPVDPTDKRDNYTITAGSIDTGGGIIAGGDIITIHRYTDIIVSPDQIEDQPPAPGRPPYKGLDYYREEDGDLFFGREALIDQIVDRLPSSRFLALFGASGSGVSSVLRAGVVPRLLFADNWAIYVMKPGPRPLESLAEAFTRDEPSLDVTSELMEALGRDSQTLNIVAAQKAVQMAVKGMLLVIDQFEELFTLCRDESERAAFIENIIEAIEAKHCPLKIMIGIRADHFASVVRYEGLGKLVEKQQMIIPEMRQEELVRAISEPAKHGGWQFVQGLVEQIVKDTSGMPGYLPLLSHALLETWERRRGNVMTLDGYLSTGGVEGSISRMAEEFLQRTSPEEAVIVKHIFLTLIQVGEGNADTRRVASIAEMTNLEADTAQVIKVLAAMAQARLVVVDAKYVQIAHEALIRSWPRLHTWIAENRERLQFIRRLRRDALRWEEMDYNDDAVYRGTLLDQVVDLLPDIKVNLDTVSEQFIQASLDQRQQELNRKEALEQAAAQRKIKKPALIEEIERQMGIEILPYNTMPPDTTIGYLLNEQEEIVALSLGHARLTAFPEPILRMDSLRKLSLFNNNISKIPTRIGSLRQLTALNLCRNEIRQLPEEIGQLKRLSFLDLAQNQLVQVPQTMASIPALNTLNLADNPLQQPPPEIAKQGVEAIFSYLRNIPQESKEINEAKIILVGDPEVGKTTLVRRIIFGRFAEKGTKRTIGIDIRTWPAKIGGAEHIDFRIWDFGGQEIYKSTHQFFLTKQSIYLLVWNARRSRDYDRLYRWLYLVDAHSENSPIIIVMTKAAEIDDDLNLRELREKFPQIVGRHMKVDSETGQGIESLKELIISVAENLPSVRSTWVPSWLQVRRRLETDHRSWIRYDEFEQICLQEGLTAEEIHILDEYLHDLGVIIHFRSGQYGLQNIVILKPEWATDAVYQVLDSQLIRKKNGLLSLDDLPAILVDESRYPRSVYVMLLDLMRRFEIAFAVQDSRYHLVPHHLPPSEELEYVWDGQDNLLFAYTYDFLPPGVLPRFIANVHPHIEPADDGSPICWSDGVVINWENTRAEITVNRLESRINIRLAGRYKRQLLAIITYQFDEINHAIKRLRIEKKIPCRCSPGCPNEFDFDKLQDAEQRGIATIQCPETWLDTPLKTLLEGYSVQEKESSETAQLVFNYNTYGDYIAGDSTKIREIRDAQSVAVGRQSQSAANIREN